MFVGFNTHNSDWTKIKSTYGVSKVLVFNNKPSEISFDLIFALKNRYEEKNLITKKAKLKKGDNVKFNSGPFVNLIAKIESVDDKNRIWLILEAMGRHRKLKIQETQKINFTTV